MIKNISPEKISNNNSIYKLIYYGTTKILIKSLNKTKIKLT